jgi:hypothetical protein
MTTAVKEFEVTIGVFKKVTLNVDMKTASKVSTLFGGLVPAFTKIQNYDPTAYTQIILIGTGKTAVEIDKEFAGFEADVFEIGLPALREPLEKYLNLLSNGGRELTVAAA